MWKRFKRAVRSFFGFFVSGIENPELILEQNIRDLNDQVPRMNESIAMVRANLTLLEKENQKYSTEVNDLTAKVKASIQATRDDLAASYATRLQMEKQALERNAQQLETAKSAYEKAINVKKMFMREKETKTQEAMNAIRDARRAKWQAKVADAMESFVEAACRLEARLAGLAFADPLRREGTGLDVLENAFHLRAGFLCHKARTRN